MAPCNLSKEVDGFLENAVDMFDQEISVIKTSMFKRQVSAPGRLGKGIFARQLSAPVHRLAICEERIQDTSTDDELDGDGLNADFDLDEDGLNADLKPFQPSTALTRQISVMSDLSAKAPSRQVTAMSDWEPISGSNMKRQETDEQWPTWNGKDPLIDNDELGSDANGMAQTFGACGYPCRTLPIMLADDMNMQAMSATQPPMQYYYVEFLPQANLPENADQAPFPRKRESLIDLAKKQQEQDAARRGDAAASDDIKFCPWCGGSFRPSFKFCVFCGNEFCSRKSTAP